MFFIRVYIERVLKTREQFLELDLPVPRDRMPSSYYHMAKNGKGVYYGKSGEPAIKFKTRSGKALEKRF